MRMAERVEAVYPGEENVWGPMGEMGRGSFLRSVVIGCLQTERG